jgi:hypothetical protein
MTEPTRSIVVSVAPCPACSGEHQHHVRVRSLGGAAVRPAVVLFAGPTDAEDDPGGSSPPRGAARQTWDVVLRCPRVAQDFTWSVGIAPGPGERIAGLLEQRDDRSGVGTDRGEGTDTWAGGDSPNRAAAEADPVLDREYDQWVAGSAGTAREYSRTMLTTALSAIPVFYAVLQYVGFGRVTRGPIRLIGLLPPVLFLLSAALFVAALRPRVSLVSRVDFAAWRANRFTEMNRWIRWGTAVFAAGVLTSLASFQIALVWKP